ncbi:MAG: DUF4011 domain-containing protein [Bacteroidales bacterium]|nr:DUF4011 domain-containing protein [Bacteroidales bacterium]
MGTLINSENDGIREISCGEYTGCVTVEYIPDANYAMVRNNIPVLGYIEIANKSEKDWSDIYVEISGEHVETSKIAIPFLEKGVQIQIKELKIVPNVSYLVNLTEAIGTTFSVKISTGEVVIFDEKYDINLLAFNQWSGSRLCPEILSAFVTPNHPLVTKVLEHASHELKELTGDSSLDGYLTQDVDRARSIVAAIYRALKKEKLIYAVPPASFGKSGQRVRLSDEVLTNKVGTCLDLTLLMASCIEAVGMNPIIVLFRNHALLGVWLSDEMAPNMIMDDPSFLTKATAAGIYRMVLVESTCLTGDDSFEKAASSAEATVRDSETENGNLVFDMYIDVARCRLEKILPLPQRVLSENGWNIVSTGEEHDNEANDLEHVVTYEDPSQEAKPLTKQDIWERKLLDMTMNNRLLKMVTGGRLTQFWSFGIDNIENILRAGSEMKMIGCMNNSGVKGIHDSQAEIFQHKDLVQKEIEGKRLISYLNEKDLEAPLKSINRAARNSIEENGANSLFLALGTLRFYEDEISQRPCYAPLILLPVSLVRKGGYMSYVLRARDEETMFNPTLREYLRQTFKIDIKGIDPMPTDESGVDVRQILSMVRKSIAEQPRWNVLDECFLGVFSFSKFVMWNDIHCNADKLRENKVVSSLLNGTLEWAE